MKPSEQLAWDLKELFPLSSFSLDNKSPEERRALRMQQAVEDSHRIIEFAKVRLDFETSSELLPEAAQQIAHYCYRELVKAHAKASSANTETVLNKPRISVLVPTCRPANLSNLLRQFFTQDYPNMELLLLLHHQDFELKNVTEEVQRIQAQIPGAHEKAVQIHSLPLSLTLGECLNVGRTWVSGEFCAKMDDDNFYGVKYFSDLMLPFSFSDADVVGKSSFYSYLEARDQTVIRFEASQHRYTSHLQGGAFIARSDLMSKVNFKPIQQGSDTDWMKRCFDLGIKLYAADPYNFISYRSINPQSHTWKISDSEYLLAARVLASGLATDVVMI